MLAEFGAVANARLCRQAQAKIASTRRQSRISGAAMELLHRAPFPQAPPDRLTGYEGEVSVIE